MHAAVPSTVVGAARARAAPLVSPAARQRADAPHDARVDRTCVELLHIEMAATLAASAAYQTRRANDLVAQLHVDDAHARIPPALSSADEAEMANARMEAVGAHVGGALMERLAPDRARSTQTLERVKFVCKELWTALWDKQVDNLRTNHRGVFVLHDASFRPLRTAHAAPGLVAEQLAFATGVVQGALERLGVAASVHADASQAPQCAFHVRVAS
ncbi:hypothetical protein MBRA1_003602 [Malassezia brasiliensis]|uniref:Trafficking protein particle complex subunit 6B n=1 Tax=Malassezia brasiliensis TaxID=1821822 RepID=A0AAF0DW77_9BASI|nr:hypothetical protein MBRA1_003602 [Malassezia brasiliensis]